MRHLFLISLLLISASGFSQLTDQITNQANTYFQGFPEERLYVHLSGQEILAGERLWFRIYPYAPSTGMPTGLSKVAYAELLNSEGEAVTRARVSMGENGGQGYIELPANLDAGYYSFRSYTQWMRNFEVRSFYNTQIKVINTFKQLGLQSVRDSARLSVRFFPEGGDLVAGNETRVAVLTENMAGIPITLTGEIIDRDTTIVARVSTDQFGLGSFQFTPETGQSYQFRQMRTDSSWYSTQLPAVRPTGISMTIKNLAEEFQISISERGTIPGNLYLVVLSNGKLISVQNKVSEGGKSSFRISKSDLPDGISQITLMNNEGLPVSERLVFVEPRAEGNLTLELPKTTFNTREPVQFSVGLNEYVLGDISVSVHLIDPEYKSERLDFPTYRWLGSEVRMPQYLKPALMTKSGPDIHLLLQVYGWRRYQWEEIRNSPSVEFIPEFRGPVIMGESSMPEEVVFIGYPDSLAHGSFVEADDQGNFAIETPQFSGNKNVVAVPPIGAKVNILSPFEDTYISADPNTFDISSERAEYLLKRSESLQVQNIFGTPDIPVAVERASFYGTPTVQFYLDEYTRFPVMEEVMREYVYGVFVRKRSDQYVFKVIDDARNETMEEDPLILLDGIPVDSADDIMDLDPAKIKRIDVYRGRYGIGTKMAGGVVAFYSYRSDLAGYSLPESTLQQRYDGVQPYKEFFVPNESLNVRTPDFRSLLYWNPSIEVDGNTNVSFPASDVTGTFEIMVQGRTATGEPLSASTQFQVD